jgi:hypothetical protein
VKRSGRKPPREPEGVSIRGGTRGRMKNVATTLISVLETPHRLENTVLQETAPMVVPICQGMYGNGLKIGMIMIIMK